MAQSSKTRFSATRPVHAEHQGMSYTVRPSWRKPQAAVQAFDESDEHPETSRLRGLWKAVILQAVTDVRSQAKRGSTRYNRRKAENWLFSPNRDFAEVCDLAGFQADTIRHKAAKARERVAMH